MVLILRILDLGALENVLLRKTEVLVMVVVQLVRFVALVLGALGNDMVRKTVVLAVVVVQMMSALLTCYEKK